MVRKPIKSGGEGGKVLINEGCVPVGIAGKGVLCSTI